MLQISYPPRRPPSASIYPFFLLDNNRHEGNTVLLADFGCAKQLLTGDDTMDGLAGTKVGVT